MTDQTPSTQELRGLMERATGGPWEHSEILRGNEVVRNELAGPDSEIAYDINDPADADLIAAMRNALPALLDRIERLEGALKPFASIKPSSFFPEDGSEGEGYAAVIADPLQDGVDFTGADLAEARAALGSGES